MMFAQDCQETRKSVQNMPEHGPAPSAEKQHHCFLHRPAENRKESTGLQEPVLTGSVGASGIKVWQQGERMRIGKILT